MIEVSLPKHKSIDEKHGKSKKKEREKGLCNFEYS